MCEVFQRKGDYQDGDGSNKKKSLRKDEKDMPLYAENTGPNATMALLYGVDMNSIPGMNDYTALRLIGETESDMNRFPTPKNFVSWLGLSPKSHRR
jgi:hypothetical protein